MAGQNLNTIHRRNAAKLSEKPGPLHRLKVGFLPLAAKRPGAADTAVEIFAPGSEEAVAMEKVIFKDRDRERYTPAKVVEMVQQRGFPKFSIYSHTQLWKHLDGKNPGKGYGRAGDYKDTWVWFDRWVERAIEYCENEGERFK